MKIQQQFFFKSLVFVDALLRSLADTHQYFAKLAVFIFTGDRYILSDWRLEIVFPSVYLLTVVLAFQIGLFSPTYWGLEQLQQIV
jgi:hypothetical protein